MSNALRIEIRYSIDGYMVRAERAYKGIAMGIALGPENEDTLRKAIKDLSNRLRA